jgi:hypothetical protein
VRLLLKLTAWRRGRWTIQQLWWRNPQARAPRTLTQPIQPGWEERPKGLPGNKAFDDCIAAKMAGEKPA